MDTHRGPSQPAIEDYLKVIFALGEWPAEAAAETADDRPVTTTLVATRLGVSPSSVSGMVRKLVDLQLARHERYGAISLTPTGRTTALQVLRRHRLIETYLVRALGYTWDEVHDEAEVLEHAVSSRLIERMDRALGRPWRDPHGDPIPTADGVLHQPPVRPLSTLAAGESGYLARISDADPQLLRHVEDQGLRLDDWVTVRSGPAYTGGTTVEFRGGGRETLVDLGEPVLAALWITDAPPLSATGGGCPYVGCRHLTPA